MSDMHLIPVAERPNEFYLAIVHVLYKPEITKKARIIVYDASRYSVVIVLSSLIEGPPAAFI